MKSPFCFLLLGAATAALAATDARVLIHGVDGAATFQGILNRAGSGALSGSLAYNVSGGTGARIFRWQLTRVTLFPMPTTARATVTGDGRVDIVDRTGVVRMIDGRISVIADDLVADNLAGDRLRVTFVPRTTDADRLRLPDVGLNATSGGTVAAPVSRRGLGVAIELDPRIYGTWGGSVTSFSPIDGRIVGGFSAPNAYGITYGSPRDPAFYVTAGAYLSKYGMTGSPIWAPIRFPGTSYSAHRLANGNIVAGSGLATGRIHLVTPSGIQRTFDTTTPWGNMNRVFDLLVVGDELYVSTGNGTYDAPGPDPKGILRFRIIGNWTAVQFDRVFVSTAAPNPQALQSAAGMALAPSGEILMVDAGRKALFSYNRSGTPSGPASPPMPNGATPERARFGRDGYLYVGTTLGLLRMTYSAGGRYVIVPFPGPRTPYLTVNGSPVIDFTMVPARQ